MVPLIDVAANDRIVVDVIQFPMHHFIVPDLLRMASFFPELITTLRLVISFVDHELPKNRFGFSLDEYFENHGPKSV